MRSEMSSYWCKENGAEVGCTSPSPSASVDLPISAAATVRACLRLPSPLSLRPREINPQAWSLVRAWPTGRSTLHHLFGIVPQDVAMKKHTKDAATQGTDGRRWGRRPGCPRGRPEVVSSTS